jgi:hypothetical protein
MFGLPSQMTLSTYGARPDHPLAADGRFAAPGCDACAQRQRVAGTTLALLRGLLAVALGDLLEWVPGVGEPGGAVDAGPHWPSRGQDRFLALARHAGSRPLSTRSCARVLRVRNLKDTRRPCYARRAFAVVRPSGETLGFTCADHLPAWAGQIHGRYLVLEQKPAKEPLRP